MSHVFLPRVHHGKAPFAKRGRVLRAFFVLALVFGAQEVRATDAASQDAETVYLHETHEAKPPLGFPGFCKRYPSQCSPVSAGRTVRLSAVSLATLKAINDWVNGRITETSDLDAFGREEYWTLPKARGDCEDFALLKRQSLIAIGFPSEALMVTVVRTADLQTHAVLSVATDQGELILDNLQAAILPWQVSGYAFIKRQSFLDPSRWSFLEMTHKQGLPSL